MCRHLPGANITRRPNLTTAGATRWPGAAARRLARVAEEGLAISGELGVMLKQEPVAGLM
jgi:hypothetical protein